MKDIEVKMKFKGKVSSYPENFRGIRILISAKYGSHDVDLDNQFQFGVTNLTKKYLETFPRGKVPSVELEEKMVKQGWGQLSCRQFQTIRVGI